MANPRVTLEVDVIPHTEALLAEARKLSAQARAGTGGMEDVESRAQAIAQEIALTRRLADEKERAARGGESLRAAPTPGTEAARIREQSFTDIRALKIQAREAGPEVAARVKELAGTRVLQQRLYQQPGFEEPLLPLARTTFKVGEQQKDVKQDAAILAAARETEEYTQTLLLLDVETKRFLATMEALRAGSEEFAQASVEAATAQKQLAAVLAEQQATSAEFLTAATEAATAQKQLAATLNAELATSEEYLAATTEAATAQKQLAANLSAEQTVSVDYVTAATEATTAQKQLSARLTAEQATLQEFLTAASEAATAQQQLAATLKAELASSEEYVAASTEAATAQRQLAATLSAQQAASEEFLATSVEAATAQKRLATNITAEQTGSEEFVGASVEAATAQKQLAGKLQGEQAASDEYVAALAESAAAQRQLAAKLAAQLATEDEYLGAATEAATSQKQLAATLNAQLATSDEYVAAATAATTAQRELAATLNAQLAVSNEYVTAVAESAVAQKQLTANLSTQLAVSDEYLAAATEAAVGQKQLAAGLQAQLLGSEEYVAAATETVVAQKQLQAEIQIGAQAEAAYVESTAALAASRRRLQAEAVLQTHGVSPVGLTPQEVEDKAAALQRLQRLSTQGRQVEGVAPEEITERAQLRASYSSLNAALLEETAAIEGFIQSEAAAKVAKDENRIAINEEATALKLARTGGGGLVGRGAAVVEGLPQAGPAGGVIANLLKKGATTAQSTIGAFSTAALVFGLVEAVKNATELEERFASLKSLLQDLGRGDEFNQLKAGIEDVSNATGVAATEVEQFAERIIGITGSPTQALAESRAAMELSVVSGTKMNDLMQSLTPVSEAFGLSFAQIGDEVVSLHDKFGVSEKDIIKFFGETAVVGKEAGFTFQELGVIAATGANAIGISLSAAGNQFARIIETMQGNQEGILSVFRRRPETKDIAEPILEAFSAGRGGDAFKLLLDNFGKLDQYQQQSLIQSSGMKRDWAFLTGVFSHHARTLAEINYAEAHAADNAGTLDERFKAISNTVGQTVDRIQELFKNLVAGVAATGAGATFAVMLQGIELVLKAGMELVHVFNDINNALKFGPFDQGLLTYIVGIGTAVLLIKGAFAAYNLVKGQTMRVNALLTATEERLGISAAEASTGIDLETGSIAAGNQVKKEAITETGLLTTEMEAEGVAGGGAGAGASGGLLARLLRRGGGAAAGGGEAATQLALPGLEAGVEAGGGAATQLALPGLEAAGAGAAGATATGLLTAESGITAFGASVASGIGGIASAVTGMASGIAGAVSSAFGGATVAGAFTVGPVLAGVATGVVATKLTAAHFHEELQGPQQQALDNIKKMRTEDLEKLAKESQGFWDRVVDNAEEGLFNVQLPHSMYVQEFYARKRAPIEQVDTMGKIHEFTSKISDQNLKLLDDFVNQSDEAKDFAKQYGLTDAGGEAHVTRENLERNLGSIEAAAARNEEGGQKIMEGLDNVLHTQKSLGDLARAVDDAQKKTADKAPDPNEVQKYLSAQYDPKGGQAIGLVSPTERIAQLEQIVADEKRRLSSAPDQAAAIRQLNADEREIQEVRNKFITDRVDALAKRAQAESATPAEDTLKAHIAALPQLATDEDRYAQLPALRDETRKWFNEQVSHITDPVKRLQAEREGIEIPTEVRTLDLKQLAISEPYSKAIEALYGKDRKDKVTQDIIQLALDEKKSLRDAYVAFLQREYDRKKALGLDDKELAAAIAAAKNLPDTGGAEVKLDPLTVAKNEAKQTQADINLAKAQQENRGRRAQANLDLQAKQKALDDLTRQADIGGENAPRPEDITNAKAEVDKAKQNVADVEMSVAEALMQWDVINAFGDPVKQANARLAAANKNVADTLIRVGGDTKDPEFTKSLEDRREAEIQALQSQQDHDLAVADWAEVLANGDPYDTAKARLDKTDKALSIALKNARGDWNATPVIKAAQDRTKAKQDFDKQGQALDDARRGVLEAQFERDPLQLALLGQQKANEDLAKARGTINEQIALAAKIKADHTVEDAIDAGIQANVGLAVAIAEAQGDTVKAAFIAADEAQRELDRALKQGITDDKVLAPLRANALKTAADAQRGARSREEQVLDFQLQMGQITTAAAIAGLQLILSQTKEGTDEYMSLALKIHQLEQQAGQDLQFNLPTTLGLPTLYEARRVSQSTAMGIGYQDNRNVQMIVQVNGAQDPMTVTNQVVNALAGMATAAPTYTPQVGMGV